MMNVRKYEKEVNKTLQAFERMGIVFQHVVQHAQDLNQESAD